MFNKVRAQSFLPHSKVLVHEVYEELGTRLLWGSDSYFQGYDDLPYWVDVPAEEDSDCLKGMLLTLESFFRKSFILYLLT